MKHFAPALASLILLLSASHTAAQERLCDTSFEDCRQPLWTLIDNENVGIDVSYWFMQDTSLANKIIARHQAGVPVRLLVDPRANPTYTGNQAILNQFAAAGVPMRYKVADCILHRKFMLFAGQNQVEFSGANYSPSFFVPTNPFVDYIDEAIYFTTASAIVNSFKTIMDNMWTDTSAYGNYANVSGPLTRRYPTFPIDPELNFPPGGTQDFYDRTAFNFNQETQKIDIIMYRITNDRYTAVTNAAKQRGIPVRLLTEQNEYRNRDRPWDSYNVDLMYMAGVQIRIRGHQGLNHQKSVILYGRGMTIFGSSNWTGPSSNCQPENNYFTTKPFFFNWFVNQFERKWNSTTETQPFTPLPPDPPVYQTPANNATGLPVTNAKLQWEGREYAHKFDIYFGTTPNPPLYASDQFIGRVDNGSAPEIYSLPTLAPGTRYYWRIVSKTMANITATNGTTWSFVTAGTPGGAPTISSISPSTGSTAGGTSVTITGTNFQSGAGVTIGGVAATNVNVTNSTSISAVTPSHAAGTVSVTVTNPDAQNATLTNSYTYASSPPPSSGDVVLYAAEAPVRIGSWNLTSDSSAAGGARLFNPDVGGPKLTDAFANPPTYFDMTFQAQAGISYRLWIRGKAQGDSPFNDSVFAQFSDSTDSGGAAVFRIGTTSSTVINLEDCSGCGLAGWGWQDNGWGAGVFGQLIRFANSGTHTIRIQPREDGLSIDQIVLSPSTYLNVAPGALKNDNTILPESGGGGSNPAPTVSSVSPNSGSTAGGTAVTISGTNFIAGATVSFGGSAAGNVNVANNTTVTAVTPAHAEGTVNVVVTNAGSQSGTLANGFTYDTAPTNPPPTVADVSPASGPVTGGTAVTIIGTNFVTGATVSFGGAAASNVNVTSSTSISATTPAHAAGNVNVTVTNSDGGSDTAANAYTYTTSQGETVLLADDFNNGSIDTAKWNPNSLFSGFTDPGLPVAEANQRLEIGPLLQNASGSHYAGVRSVNAFSFVNAYCYVEVVQVASSSTSADAMLTIGIDANRYYRIFVEGGSIMFQKRINGAKVTLLTASYSAANDRYWRIRHQSSSGNVVFETAPDNGGAPGTWTVRFSEQWNTSAIPLGSILLELKGGTWQPEGNAPGKVIVDDFRAARP